MGRWRTLSAVAAALATAVTFLVAPPASAAVGSWTINLGCKPGDGQPIDIVIVQYSFDGLVPNREGYVVGRHTYGAGQFDWVQTLSTLTTDGAGHTAGMHEFNASAFTTAIYTPTPGDDFSWRVNLNGEGDVLTGVTPLGGAGCAGAAVITAGMPTVAGTAKVGNGLTASPGSWSPAGVSFSHQWYADGAPILGATGPSLMLTADQVGRRIAVTVTGSKTGYTSVSASSGLTEQVALGTLAPTPKPTIKGKKKVGKTLTAKPGTWGPGSVAKTYKWYADGKAIAGAKGKKLTLKASQAGKRVTVKVTGTQAGYATVTKVSAATAKIKT